MLSMGYPLHVTHLRPPILPGKQEVRADYREGLLMQRVRYAAVLVGQQRGCFAECT
jgi:hypothetical protein